ncbi:MAG: CYTH domain-containing protein [Firmicutes bacterium]|nr:CYTH domain-containing protein [Bacillota bacterium]
MSKKEKIYEIERKFLLTTLPEGLEGYTFKDIEQCYISTNPTIRIRSINDKDYVLTIKGKGKIKKEEYELPLDKSSYENLKQKKEGITIQKRRYLIPLPQGLTAELDIYKGELEGFMNVEVEFSSLEEAVLFVPPSWFGREVSQNKRYSNASLSKWGVPEEENEG